MALPELTDSTPDHSTLSRIRQRLLVAVHEAVLVWILKVLSKAGLLKGKTVVVDTTPLISSSSRIAGDSAPPEPLSTAPVRDA